MTYFFFDTETTGFTKNHLPIDHEDQPHCVQVAGYLVDDDRQVKNKFSLIINHGVDIPTQASDIHRIRTTDAAEFGVPSKTGLSVLMQHMRLADRIIAHNIKFDLTIAQIWAAREGQGDKLDGILGERETICTMELAKPIMELPPTERMLAAGFDGFKSPNMSEAYKHFTGETLMGAHDAFADVTACMGVYFEIEATANE